MASRRQPSQLAAKLPASPATRRGMRGANSGDEYCGSKAGGSAKPLRTTLPCLGTLTPKGLVFRCIAVG
jgi:hypothetical protein